MLNAQLLIYHNALQMPVLLAQIVMIVHMYLELQLVTLTEKLICALNVLLNQLNLTAEKITFALTISATMNVKIMLDVLTTPIAVELFAQLQAIALSVKPMNNVEKMFAKWTFFLENAFNVSLMIIAVETKFVLIMTVFHVLKMNNALKDLSVMPIKDNAESVKKMLNAHQMMLKLSVLLMMEFANNVSMMDIVTTVFVMSAYV